MGAVVTRKRISAEEFRRMAEAGIFGEDERIELLDGDLIKMTPIGPRHAHAVRMLYRTLTLSLGERAFVDSQNPLLLLGDNEFYPDVVVLKPRAEYRELPKASDVLLVIEVADSSLAYDRNMKGRVYAGSGVPEYWVVDLQNRCAWVHRQPTTDGYQEVFRAERHASLEVMSTPVPLDNLF